MEVSSTRTNGIAIIFIKGSITSKDRKCFQNHIDSALNDDPIHLNLNLQGVPIVDSGIIGLMMVTRNRCKQRHIGFSVSCLHPQLQDDFDLLNLGTLIPIYATDQDVMASAENR
ncbi:MAG: anti-sigma factor antagonist [Nitrospirales bacterium]|nr:MAG: anti-sigma factor antagonist [Nitrospirales bacterium]